MQRRQVQKSAPHQRSRALKLSSEGGFDEVAVEAGHAVIDEFGHVLLGVPVGFEGVSGVFEELGGDAGAFGGGDRDTEPCRAAVLPLFVEETAFAAGGAEEPEIAVGGGEHGKEGLIHVVIDARGLVDEHERDGGEAAHGAFIAGKADDPGAVGEEQGDRVIAIAARADAEFRNHAGGFTQEFGALPLGRAGDENFAPGLRVCAMYGLGSGDEGLAPLTAAVENALSGGAEENFELRRIGMKAEAVAHEGYGVGIVYLFDVRAEYEGEFGLASFQARR